MQLRIGTYNIRHGSEKGRYLDQIADLIKESNLDICGLQEIDWMISRSGKEDTLNRIAKRAGFAYQAFFKAINYQDGEYGLGIISRYPFQLEKVTDLPNCLYEKRILVEVKIQIQDRSLAFFNTHLDLGDFKQTRQAQFALIQEAIASQDPFVLVGDFNVTDWTKPPYHFEWENLKKVGFANQKEKPLYTFNDDRFLHLAPIDNIITNQHYTFEHIELSEASYSDHRLLIAQINFNRKE